MPSDSADDTSRLLAERRNTHGTFAENARVDRALQRAAQESLNWSHLADGQALAVEMILHKLARILSGDPGHADHWDDIGGYARLGRDCR
jgi:Domain of unknown function (DUF6378)